ncbi:MAG: hypothetical protein WAK93_20975 [Solirubrobacteraceae bacterium]
MRRMFVVAAVAAVVMPMWAASALAAPSVIATPGAAQSPAVAVGSDGSAIVAWANTMASPNTVQWCVLPGGGGACSKTGDLQPADSAQYVHGVQVLNEGSSIVILADVFGASDAGGFVGTDYENVQEWQSTDGGQSFNAINGGKAVASGDPSNDTFALNAVALPGGNALGVGFDTASADPTFHALSLTAPTSCGRAADACPDGYATLEPSTNPDTISNPPDGANFAANSDGVLGIYFTNFTTGPFGCSNAQTTPFGTAFVFGDGLQSPSNNYNVSPGQPNTAWRVAATQADCNVDYPAVGGGPSGFGVIEDNTLTKQTMYHHYDGISNSFDTKPVVVSNTGEQQPSVSQDGAGGVYAVYLNDGIGGPVTVAYSYNGGTTWSGPNAIAADPAGAIAGLTSNVNATGQGWATWVENGSVFAEPFTAADSVIPAQPVTLTTSQTAGTATGASISIPEGTVGETDTATLAGADASGASGTVTYTLYGSPSCTASSAIAASTKPVSGGVAAASTPVSQLLAPGKYYWRAVYSGNAGNAQGAKGNLPASTACGSEELAIGVPNTVAANATSNGKTVIISVSCATFPCTVTLTLTASETVTVKADAQVAKKTKAKAKAKAKKKKKTITLGKATFKLKKKGKVALKLSKAGRSYLAKRKGKVKLNLAVSQRIGAHAVVSKHTLTVKVSHPKKKKKK